MSQKAPDKTKNGPTDASKPQGPPPTPFDHPLFLPVLLFAGMLWFGYDGWINTDEGMLEHRTFNRVGFALLTVWAAWAGYRGCNEFNADRTDEAD